MGIHHIVFAVSETDLGRITAEPPLVEHLFDCEPGSRDAADLPRVAFELADTWQAIDFVLTGSIDSSDTPDGFLLQWGMPIGDIDVGYGPARALTSAQVRDVADALAKLSPTAFAARIDMGVLEAEGVYHADAFTVQDLVGIYTELCEFVRTSAAEQRGFVVALV